MRPVERKLTVIPTRYHQTFNTHAAGAPLLEVFEATLGKTGGSAVYQYLAGTLPVPTLPKSAVKQPSGWESVVSGPHSAIPAQIDLGAPDRSNAGNVLLQPQILGLEYHTQQKRFQRIMVLLSPDEATEVVRLNSEDDWNGTSVLGPMNGKAFTAIATEALREETVPGNDRPGKFYGYRGAVRDLENAIGGYCSYCEARRQDAVTMDVEHRLPKAFYPSDRLRWDNFVLGCAACNRIHKNDQPTRTEAIRRAIETFHSAAPPKYKGGDRAPVVNTTTKERLPYHQMVSAATSDWLWPDLNHGAGTPAVNYSLLCVRYHLREYDNTGNPIRWIPAAEALDLRNRYVGDADHATVRADIWDPAATPAAPVQRYVRVEAREDTPGTGVTAFDNHKRDAAQRTIAMAGLNRPTNAYGDRRIEARTEAWFMALERLQSLQAQLALLDQWSRTPRIIRVLKLQWNAPPVQLTQDQLDMAALLAEGGYYSVWMTVFARVGGANGLGTQLAEGLARALDARAATRNVNRYHGTGLTDSVLNLLPRL